MIAITDMEREIQAHGQNTKVLKFKEEELLEQIASGKGDVNKLWELLEKNFEAQMTASRIADDLAGEYLGTCDDYTLAV